MKNQRKLIPQIVYFSFFAAISQITVTCSPQEQLGLTFQNPNKAFDKTAPTLVSVIGQAGSNTITLTFSEPVFSTALGTGTFTQLTFGFQNNSGSNAAAFTGMDDNEGADSVMVISTDTNLGLADAADQITVAANQIFDGAGNAMLPLIKFIGVLAGQPPILTGAQTMDCDKNGKIDHYKLTFDSNINDSTFPGYVLNGTNGVQSNWQVNGISANVFLDHGTSVNAACTVTDMVKDNILYVKFAESGTNDTDAKPDITAASPGLQDLDPTTMLQLTSGGIIETDGAPPVLYYATEKAGEKDLVVLFSEPVYTSGPPTFGNLAISDFAYTNSNAGGATAFASIIDADGADKSITIIMDDLFVNGDHGVDRIAVVTNDIFDPAGNAAINHNTLCNASAYCTTTVTTGDAPAITAAETMDIDCNGKIDHYKITFDTSIDTGTIAGYNGANAIGSGVATGWAVAGYSNVKIDTRDNAPSCGAGGPNDATRGPGDNNNSDNVIYLTFDENANPCTVFSGNIGNVFTGCDTGSKPDLTYTLPGADPRLKDFDPTLLPSVAMGGVIEQDKALPIIANSKAWEGTATLKVTFSEPIYTNTGMNGALAAGDFVYTNFNATGAATITGVTHTAGASTADITMDSNFLIGDNGQDTLNMVDTQIFDSANNAGSASRPTPEARVVPRVIAAETMDCNANGKIDHYKLTLTSAVQDSTFPGYVLNSVGGAQSAWLAAGYSGLVLQHGTSVNAACASETDTANDAVLYLKFTEGGAYDTATKPDLTTTNTPVLKGGGSSEEGLQHMGGDVAETDKAAPVIVLANGKDSNLFIQFSEPADSDGAPLTGNLGITDFIYNDGNLAGAQNIISIVDADASTDSLVKLTTDFSFIGPDHSVDKISATLNSIFDSAGNTMPVTLVNISTIKYIFKSVTYNGNLNGISGADDKCNADINKPNSGYYMALIIDVTGQRRASLTPNTGDGQLDWVLQSDTDYYQTDGFTLIGRTNPNRLFSFPLNNVIGTGNSWTGLLPDWTSYVSGTYSGDCMGWTTNFSTDKATVGGWTTSNYAIGSLSLYGCNLYRSLICVEQ